MSAENVKPRRVFEEGPGAASHRPVLPWKISLQMSWANITNRLGRFFLVFLGIAVVVAFLMSSFTYQSIVSDLSRSDDVHIRAVLEKAGIFASDAESKKYQEDRNTWLMGLSCLLCLVVITNTMLMSVGERVKGIGTLKCLGALDGFIVRLIMLESVFIGIVGSLAGALLGYLLTVLQVGASLEFSILSARHLVAPLVVWVPISVGAGTVITVLAAVYPTYVASKMRPVEAMRVEV
ncbi:MAG: ABC transporter permease [Planctomycetota bacterium]|jgi:ABC-type lipoprotein release transport system permease subunit